MVGDSSAVLGSAARVLRSGGCLTAPLSLTERDGAVQPGPPSVDRAAYARAGLQIVEWRPATAAEVTASDSNWAKRLDATRRRPVWLFARGPQSAIAVEVWSIG